jgi:hypothetical protein
MALLYTIGDLHSEPLRYDLNCLQTLVANLAPDLLCVEITQEAWESGQLSAASVEIGAALVPVSAVTDIVLVPVAPTPERFGDYPALPGWRQSLARWSDLCLRWGQRRADGPEAIHGPIFGAFCHTLCALTELAWTSRDRAAWEAQNRSLVENILQVARQDPGRRTLVVVQCQRVHRIAPLLKAHSEELEIVRYQEL